MTRIFTLLTLVSLSLSALAQTDVYFKINHKLGTMPFSMSTTVQNDQGDNFQFERMDYYISQIKLTYDGGQDTLLADTYVMVKADQSTNLLLGNFNINSLESIEFGIGVDPGSNHSDITQYPSNHALSFQSPSMHWGWAAGYRFAALEGKAGSNMSQTWQLHALGDNNYGYATINTAGTVSNGDLIVALDADYTKALKNISVNGNLNYHGESQQAPTVMQNFQTEVFTEGAADIGVEESEVFAISLAPNPTSQNTSVVFSGYSTQDLTLMVLDISGRRLLEKKLNGDREVALEMVKSGMYLVQVFGKDELIASEKLIVTN